MSKRTQKMTLSSFLRDWLKNCALYWFLFCLIEYVHHGHYFWKKELIFAVVLSPIIPALKRVFRENQGGIRPNKPEQPAA